MMSDFQLMSWSEYQAKVVHFHRVKKDQGAWSWGLQKLDRKIIMNTDSFLSGGQLPKIMK